MKNIKINRVNNGFTLPEIALSVGLILGLSSITQFSISEYINNQNRAGCVLNQSAINKAIESKLHITGIPDKTTTWQEFVVGDSNLIPQLPICKTGGTYQGLTDLSQGFTDIGYYVTCNLAETDNHVSPSYRDLALTGLNDTNGNNKPSYEKPTYDEYLSIASLRHLDITLQEWENMEWDENTKRWHYTNVDKYGSTSYISFDPTTNLLECTIIDKYNELTSYSLGNERMSIYMEPHYNRTGISFIIDENRGSSGFTTVPNTAMPVITDINQIPKLQETLINLFNNVSPDKVTNFTDYKNAQTEIISGINDAFKE